MTELKTKASSGSVDNFLKNIKDDITRKDCLVLADIIKDVSGEEPKMWGSSVVGFGSYHYKYESGRKGDWFVTGFSPRKGNITLYLMAGFEESEDLLSKLGKHKIGKSCLYVKSLGDIDTAVLKKLISKSIKEIQKRYK